MKGLSLSLCISDIIRGKVDLNDVSIIESGTAARTKEDWENLIDMYSESYWKEDSEKAKEVVIDLLKNNKIYQPRVHGLCEHNISNGHWVERDEK